MEMTYHVDPSGFGLRRVNIRREENGFGFTLRHFIVYPPDLYTNNSLGDGRRHIKPLVKVTEPVDTIFVRSVVEHGAADRAGLCVGDRIISVNNFYIGRTLGYETVVKLIQNSPDTLSLEVSPKQYDTLQLFFEETAYRPETNQRPYQSSISGRTNHTDYRDHHFRYTNNVYSHPDNLNHYLSNNTSTKSFFSNPHSQHSMSSSHPNSNSSSNPNPNPQLYSHLPRPTPYKSTPIASSGQPQPQIRPTPHSISTSKQQIKNQPQAYYPFNQDLQASQLWKIKEEPTSAGGAKSAENILTSTECNAVEFRDDFDTPQRSESMECLKNTVVPAQLDRNPPIRTGQRFASYDEASNRPSSSSQRRESTGSIPNSNVQSAMVVTMSSTKSKMQVAYPPDLALSDSGSSLGSYYPSTGQGCETKIVDRIRRSCEQKEEFLKRPNQPFMWAPAQSPSTPFPKELYAQPQKFEKIPWPPEHTVSTLTSAKPSLIQGHANSGSFDSQMKNMNVSVVNVQHFSGNASNSTSSPPLLSSESYDSDRVSHSLNQSSSMYQTPQQPRSLSPSWLTYTPRNRTTIIGSRKLHCDPPPDWNPDLASLTMEYGKDEASDEVVDSRNMPVLDDGAGGEVKFRHRNEDLDETERLVRRVSYLKATSSPIDMDRKSTSPTSPTLSPTTEHHGFGSLMGVRSPDNTEITREGQIHYKIRLGENKKGGYNRSWRQGWAQIRQSGCLYIASKEPSSRESVTFTEDSVILALSLRSGVSLENAEDYSKRKHVLRIKTSYSSVDITPSVESNFANLNAHPPSHSTPVEILIQADDANDLLLWLQCLHTELENNAFCNGNTNNFKGIYFGPDFCPKQKSLLTSFLPSPATSSHISQPTSDKTSTSASSSLPQPTFSTLHNVASPKNKTWKGKVARQWKKVHNIIETGGDSKGINPYSSIPPVGLTFGINLENCPPGHNNSLIPRVIEYSIDVVEKRGIEMVGLYRIPGNNASVATLTERLNKGEEPNPVKDPKWLDVHVVASLIKSFLRRLPDPLLTDDRYQAFIVAADDASDQDKCKERMQLLINDLPDSNYETLRVVIMHLKNVSEHGAINRMDARNLAIVFGPTIVRTAEENVTSMVQDMKNQCKIVEFLISNADDLFPERRYKKEIPENHPTAAGFSKAGKTKKHVSSSVDDLEKYSFSDALRLPTAAAVQYFTSSENNVPPLPPISPSSPTIESVRASLVQAALRKASQTQNPKDLQCSSHHNVYGLPIKSVKKGKPIDDAGFIRSYAGLNEETEQRVRKFELETRAMLSREDRSPNSSAVNIGTKPSGTLDDFKLRRLMNLDDELLKAKADLENEDIYDQLADNPSSIIHHRDRGLPIFSDRRNLSSSSICSSNSNGTVPPMSSHSSTGIASQKLGPVPFKVPYPSQSLPPKPPFHSSGNSVTAPPSMQSKSSLSSSSSPVSSLRRVSSMDRFLGDLQSNHGHPSLHTLDAAVPIDRKLGTLSIGPKYYGGSLDSLKDITQHSEGNRNGHANKRDAICEDFSPRSSEGSDLVTSLSRTLDKKLQNLRSSQNKSTTPSNPCDTTSNDEPTVVIVEKNGDINTKEGVPTDASKKFKSRNGGNGIKKSWRRKSMIERRVNGEAHNAPVVKECTAYNDKNYYRNPSLHRQSGEFATRGDPSALTKEAKTATNKLTRDCRRRHSLSGGGDILSIYNNDNSIRYFDDSDSQIEDNQTTHGTDCISVASISRTGILESHV